MLRTRRIFMVLVTMFATIAATVAISGPSSATERYGGGKGGTSRVEADFEIVGFRCAFEVTSERTTRKGITIVRGEQTGVTEASIGLMTGELTVRSIAFIDEEGNGRTFGRWTMEPASSTGTVTGFFRGTLNGPVESKITSVGYGREALSGVTVRMVTTTPGPTDNDRCDDDADPAAALSFSGEGTATARDDQAPTGAVVTESTKDFTNTVADLTAAIEGNPNLRLVKTVDHAAAAASRDLTLGPTTELFFGNPSLGTPLMQSAQTTGIDLPQKILIWEDLLGVVRVAYNAPAYLQSRHGIEGADGQLQTIAGALAGLTGAATGSTLEPVFDAGTVREGQGLVTVPSDKSVDEAFAAIVAALDAAPPVNISFQLEHDVNAANAGLELRPTKLVVFGNPSLGTILMQTERSVALDLPQKILVYENEAGETVIAYNDPDYVARRHGLRGQGDVLDTLSGALANFANAGT